jgi:hypothetical protein
MSLEPEIAGGVTARQMRDIREVQPSKTAAPILVTFSGIVMDSRDVQL